MARPNSPRTLTRPFRGLKAMASRITHPGNAMSWFLPNTRYDYAQEVGDGTTSSVVMQPLRWLQRNSPQAVLRVSERGPDGKTWTPIDVDSDRPAARMVTLCDEPNPYYDGATLEEATTLSEELDGNAYWMKIRNGVGAVIQLWWVPHTMMEPKRDDGSDEFITHYGYYPNGMEIRVPVEDVIHFRVGIDPANPMKGMSGFKSVLREVFTDNEAANYAATILKNMGAPGLVVSPEGDGAAMGPTDGDVEEVKRKFEQATTGDNRGRAIVMRGATKIQTVGFNPQQMTVRELRRVPEERVSGIMGVPAVVCGLGAGLDRSTFANMREAREAAAEEALIPRWQRRARTIKHQLLPDFEGDQARGLKVDHDLSDVRVLSEDQDKLAARASAMVAGGYAEIAEAREMLGLPIDDSHRVFLRSMSMLEVPAGSSGSDALAVAAPVDSTAPKMRAIAVARDEVKRLSQEQQARLQLGMHRIRQSAEVAFAKRLELAFGELGAHVAAAFAVEVVKGRKSDEFNDHRIVNATLRRAGLKAWASATLGPEYQRHYQYVYGETSKTIHSTLGVSIETHADALETQVLREGGTQMGLVDVEGQTRSSIFKALADGRADGLNPVALERKVREYVTNGGAGANVSSRAMRIARTETRHAQNYSATEIYKATGAYNAIHVLDDRVGNGDDDCTARDGQVVSFDEAMSMDSEEHPNGTLDTTTPASVGD